MNTFLKPTPRKTVKQTVKQCNSETVRKRERILEKNVGKPQQDRGRDRRRCAQVCLNWLSGCFPSTEKTAARQRTGQCFCCLGVISVSLGVETIITSLKTSVSSTHSLFNEKNVQPHFGKQDLQFVFSQSILLLKVIIQKFLLFKKKNKKKTFYFGVQSFLYLLGHLF